MTCSVLRFFIHTLSADDKYSLISKDNSMQTIQRHLYQKQQALSEFFSAFFNSALNFKHFQKKNDPHSFCISEITDAEGRASINV